MNHQSKIQDWFGEVRSVEQSLTKTACDSLAGRIFGKLRRLDLLKITLTFDICKALFKWPVYNHLILPAFLSLHLFQSF